MDNFLRVIGAWTNKKLDSSAVRADNIDSLKSSSEMESDLIEHGIITTDFNLRYFFDSFSQGVPPLQDSNFIISHLVRAEGFEPPTFSM